MRLTDEQITEIVQVMNIDSVQEIEWTPIILMMATEIQQRRQLDDAPSVGFTAPPMSDDPNRQFVSLSFDGKLININLDGVHRDSWIAVLAKESAQRLAELIELKARHCGNCANWDAWVMDSKRTGSGDCSADIFGKDGGGGDYRITPSEHSCNAWKPVAEVVTDERG